MIFGGIDPGASSGAIAFIDNDGSPVFSHKFTNWKNAGAILFPHIGKTYILITCEDVRGFKGMGLKSTCPFLKNAGGWEALLEAYDIQHILTSPRTWQAKLLGKVPKGETKAAAARYAKRRWPNMGFKGIKSEEGIIDALCIADYTRLTFRS